VETFNLILLIVGTLWSVIWFGVLLKLLVSPAVDGKAERGSGQLRDSASALI